MLLFLHNFSSDSSVSVGNNPQVLDTPNISLWKDREWDFCKKSCPGFLFNSHSSSSTILEWMNCSQNWMEMLKKHQAMDFGRNKGCIKPYWAGHFVPFLSFLMSLTILLGQRWGNSSREKLRVLPGTVDRLGTSLTIFIQKWQYLETWVRLSELQDELGECMIQPAAEVISICDLTKGTMHQWQCQKQNFNSTSPLSFLFDMSGVSL